MDKKNKLEDSKCRESREEETAPFRAIVGTFLTLGLVPRLGVFIGSQNEKRPKIIQSEVLTSS